jgi:nucleotide-binding universal stress UspA family protein
MAAAPMMAPGPTPEERAVLIQELHDAAARHSVNAEVEIVRGTQIGQRLVACASERAADLVVMGTRGRGGVARTVLGSVADIVVRHAECPVVTVR